MYLKNHMYLQELAQHQLWQNRFLKPPILPILYCRHLDLQIEMVAGILNPKAKLYIPSTPNNSNETNTFMCPGRTGRYGKC